MNRRNFIRASSIGVIGAAGLNPARPPQRVTGKESPAISHGTRMRLGSQISPNDDKTLSFLARHGVQGCCGYPVLTQDRRWRLRELEKMRERVEKHGLTLDLCALPLSSAGIGMQSFPHILLGQDPQRDRDIDLICDLIRTASKAGIPCLKYNMALHKVLRTERTPGRGGALYSTWDYQKAPDKDKIHPVTGHVPEEVFWQRITYFLEKVIPVAEESKVRMACHPHDPGVPRPGYQGIYRVLGDVEGLKRFERIIESPYHGFNLCLGSVAEMLRDPATELFDVIRYFGSRKKIFNIHFRNIIGKRDRFMEVYLDNGDINMFQVMKTLKEVDYPYLVMPDHIPRNPDDSDKLQGYAFSFGYIKGLMQVVNEDS